MKSHLFFVALPLLIAFASKSYAQAPKGPDGKALYKKGDCEVVSVKFSECTFCEDSALTKNCKKYWCSEGKCEEAPLTPQIPPDTKGQELPILKELDTTSVVPRSISFKNGRIRVNKGYKATLSEDGRAFVITRKPGGGPGLQVTCFCGFFVACSILISDGQIQCGRCASDENASCQMVIKQSKNTGWKRLIVATPAK